MKIAIASDIHGSAYWAERLMRAIETEQVDRVVLLGDVLYHGPRNDLPREYAPKKVIPLLNEFAKTGALLAVRGNCEAEVDQMVLDFPCLSDFSQVWADGHLLHLSHGHLAGNSPDQPPALPQGSALLTGHTHIKRLELVDGVMFVNPGSTSIPKDGCASYAVYENGVFALKMLDGETLLEAGWE